VLSLKVCLEYVQLKGTEHLIELCGLMSLLWMEFGFAGLFQTIRKEHRHESLLLLMVTLSPPVTLYLLMLVLTD